MIITLVLLMKTKNIIVRITEEQELILKEKTSQAGFMQKSDYIRYCLFKNKSIEDKINAIYEWIKQNGR
jgi:hypothetical protein